MFERRPLLFELAELLGAEKSEGALEFGCRWSRCSKYPQSFGPFIWLGMFLVTATSSSCADRLQGLHLLPTPDLNRQLDHLLPDHTKHDYFDDNLR